MTYTQAELLLWGILTVKALPNKFVFCLEMNGLMVHVDVQEIAWQA
jgi:hypothetical protein